MSTKELVAAGWQRRLMYTPIPTKWEQCSAEEATGHFERKYRYEYRPLYAADTIERLERERDVLAKAYDSEKVASSQYREFSAAKSREKVDEFRRAEAAQVELSALRARVERLEKALRAAKWLCNNINEFGQCNDGEAFNAVEMTIDAALTEEQP